MVTTTVVSNPTTSFGLPTFRTKIQRTPHTQSSSPSPSFFSSKKSFCIRSLNQRSEFRIGSTSTRRRRLSVICGVTQIDQTQFAETVLKSDTLVVLVEFVANWCGPCRLISPAIEWASQEYKDRLKIVKIDHDSNPQLIEEYKVYGLPALILFKDGKEVPESRREGAMTKVKLKEYIEAFLDSTAVA